ncbi:MAG: glycosyltransferase family 4 protein [Ktedonobacterales bacterium]
MRPQRIAVTLAEAGFAVSIVDVAHGHGVRPEETLVDIGAKNLIPPQVLQQAATSPVRHIIMPRWLARYYDPTNYIGWLLFKGWRTLRATMQLLRTPCDIYHANDIAALLACYIAARVRRKLLVFDVHELPLVEPHYTQSALRRALTGIFARLLRVMLSTCAGIMTVSPPLVRQLQRRYGGKQAALVRNMPVYRAPRPTDRLRRRLGLGAHTHIALYQGYFQPDRGLDGLVRAARYLGSDTVIVMLGQGDCQAELERLIAEEGVGDRVKILSAVPYAELLDWTASADIGLIVSRPAHSANVEVFLPNKLFEYLMAGLPVLTSPLEAVIEVLQTYDVGRVSPSLEPKALAQAISDMLSDRTGLDRMRANALHAAKTALRWDIEQQKLLDLYHDIIAPQATTDLEAKEIAI